MNIEDYEKEIASLLSFYKELSGFQKNYLRLWLNAKNLTEHQTTFLIYLVQLKYDDQWFENLDKALEANDASLLASDHGASLSELLTDLIDLTKIRNLRFKKIDSKYLTNPNRLELFEFAENWAMTHCYIDGTLRWVAEANRLAAFLQLLLDVKVLDSSLGRKEIDNYFTKRYLCDPMNDQFKVSKISKSGIKHEFQMLQTRLTNSPN